MTYPSTRGGGEQSGFQVTGIIVWEHKSKPKKSHAKFPSLKNVQKTLNDITCLFYLVVLHPQNYAARIRWHYHKSSDCFKNQKNSYLNQATPKSTCPIFLPKKVLWSGIPVSWNPEYPLGPPTWVPLNTCGSLEIQCSRQYLSERNTLIARWLFLGRDGSSPQQQPWGQRKMVMYVKRLMYPVGQTKMPFVGSWLMWNVSGC